MQVVAGLPSSWGPGRRTWAPRSPGFRTGGGNSQAGISVLPHALCDLDQSWWGSPWNLPGWTGGLRGKGLAPHSLCAASDVCVLGVASHEPPGPAHAPQPLTPEHCGLGQILTGLALHPILAQGQQRPSLLGPGSQPPSPAATPQQGPHELWLLAR